MYFSLSWLPVKGFFSRILLNVPIATASFPPNFSEVFVANLEKQDLGDIKKIILPLSTGSNVGSAFYGVFQVA